MTALYPVFLKIENRYCVVIGGGQVAARKVTALLAAGARIMVVSPEIGPEIERLELAGRIEVRRREYQSGDLIEATLVIGATANRDLNRQVADEANQRQIPVNIVDDPELSTFYVPAVVRRGPLTLAVSTGGASPLLARRIRAELENLFGPEYERYLNLMADLRETIKHQYPDRHQRLVLYQALIDADLLELIRRGDEGLIKERITACFQSSSD